MTLAGREAPRKTYWDYPYPHYRDLQRETPVYRDPYLSAWLVTSYAAAYEALHHPELSSAWLAHRDDLRNGSANAAYVHSVLSRWFVLTDAPEHPRLRMAVSRAFASRAIAKLEPFIRERATSLLEAARAGAGPVDAMTELAIPLTANVITKLLGLSAEMEAKLPRWGAVLAKYLASTARLDVADETADVVREMSEALRRRLHDAPSGSLLHELALASDGPRALCVDDIVSTVAFLLYAGLEATSNSIGLGMIALMDHPELRHQLHAANAETMAAAVEELLRYDTSVLQVPRIALNDLVLQGQQIRKGDVVVIVLGAANHDASRFDNPDAIDIHRDATRHIAFGHGAHFCIGATLARVETMTFFAALLREVPHFVAAGAPRWSSRSAVRTLESLPVFMHPVNGTTD